MNGSLHTLPFRGHRSEPVTLFRELLDPAEVMWAYLAEVPHMVDGGDFQVFTHIDYAARYGPPRSMARSTTIASRTGSGKPCARSRLRGVPSR